MQKNTSGTKKLNRRPCSLVSPLAGSLQLPYEHLMAPGKIKMEALTIIQTWWLTGKPIWLVGGFKHVFSTIYIYGIILPIDELKFFKMLIAPPTSHGLG
jgi:hypothetical protein